jgi:hypothetical protein
MSERKPALSQRDALNLYVRRVQQSEAHHHQQHNKQHQPRWLRRLCWC